MAVKIPSTPEGLESMLGDGAKMKEIFGDQELTKEFFGAYGANFVKKNGDTVQEIKDQVTSALYDMVRTDGKKSPIDVAMSNGKPVLSRDGTAFVAHGKGAVYNKTSAGAQMERTLKVEDRFGSIGEYCQAIQMAGRVTSDPRADDYKRKLDLLKEFQNSFGSEDPGAGGFLIPEIMRADLLQLALEQSVVRPRATVIPMSTLRVPIPTVDDTSHVSSVFGGVEFYWAEESSSLTESQATFGKVVLDAKKLTGFFKVPNELLADAPAFSGFFDAKVPQALAYFEDVAFMTETGAGTPQGFINSPASVQVTKETGQTAATIVWENIVKMFARLLPTSYANSVWIVAIDAFPQLATMSLSVGTGGGPVWIGGYGGNSGADTPPMTILGRPVIFTEKVPALGTTGDINLVDLSYYLIGDRQAVAVSASDQYAFQNDQMSYRIIERLDGRPWLQTALTPHNGSANTLSAFVQLATRS